MSILAEALIAAFDSDADITWLTEGPSHVIARFDVSGLDVETVFTETQPNEWRIAFDVHSQASASESIHASIRVFGGVFQTVREFLEVRQPQKLVFASKEEALGRLYEEYLRRQDTSLRQLGYRMAPPVRISPLIEFVIEKTTPSEWARYNQ
jgi:hypothetical protein